MFIISYNCRGFNDIKPRYINSLLSDCDIFFCVEHWLLHNKLYKKNLLGRFITINRQRIYTNMYIRAEMKDIRSIH